MKALLFLFISPAALWAQNGSIDLTRLHNYANQAKPAYITKDNTPAGNPITDIGATLGRILFYDKRLSRNNTISCSSCHHQEHAFGDPDVASTGVNGTTGRHSMRLINARFANESRFFWDERAASAEAQATQPIQDHVEMGFSGSDDDPSLADLITRLSMIVEYQVLFTATYGDPSITEDRLQRALAQFVRSIQSFDSKYDVGRALAPNDGAPFSNFTASENAGKRIFLAPPNQGGAGCAACHSPPEFDIDPNSRNNGIVTSLGGGADTTNTKSPSLRDLVSNNGTPHGGFMHDASLNSLSEVVAHYNSIPAIVPNLDPRLTQPGGPPGPAGDTPQRLNLTATEQSDLITFLGTLTGTNVYTDPKWSDPFSVTNELRLIILPTEQMTITFSGEGEERQATVSTTGVPNFSYQFQSSLTLLDDTWTSVTITADTNGLLTYTLPAPESEDKYFYRYAYATETP
ncbi:hypothetical protein NT6N_16970 [Oceaniferula spumae]|uniref:Cytochrome c domain-containing protein n=1 Tax=Oceaniferula spumae TaxID=2979115 RepID=A0AAT9FL29_9BACT